MRQILRLTKVELRRLLMNKKTYIMMAITILIISFGYIDYIRGICSGFFPSNGSSTIDNIVFPFSLGVLLGSIIWGIEIVFDGNRVKRNKAKDMINAFTDEKKTSFARMIAHMIIVTINIILCIIVYLPVCYTRMDYLFSYETYLTYSVITILPGILITLLICDGLYKISENVGVSLLIFFILTAAQFTKPFNDFFCWSVLDISIISDAFGSPGLIRFEIYTRLLILTTAIAFWLLSGLFIRKYQFGIIKSFFIRIRKPSGILLPMVFAAVSVFYNTQKDAKNIVKTTDKFLVFSCFAYSALGIGRLIYQLPIPLCKMFISEIFDNKSPDDFDEETLTTIDKFFENSLNVSETSRQLYIHRNTLVYRLDKLEKSTGLDLRVFEDAITFKIALMVVKYMKYMEDEKF